tara:strand:- start:854 stop:1750 length:897 start_codon:yes stop_codon:yes gene_type:complete
MINNINLARILLIVVTCIWGATFSEVQNTISESIVINNNQVIKLTPNLYLFFRFLIAALITLFIIPRQGIKFTKDELIGGSLCGFLIFLGYYFQKTGLLSTSSGSAAFMTSISVIIVPIILWIFSINKIGWNVWIAIAIAFPGLWLVSGDFNIGDLLAFFCAVSFAVHIIFQSIYNKKRVRVIHFFFVQALACVLISFIIAWIESDLISIPAVTSFSYPLVRSLFITSVLASFIAFIIMIWAQKILDPVQTVMIFSLEPVFTFMYDQMFLNKSILFSQWFGGIMVVIAIIVSENKKNK